jgi:hypothetical protein
MSKLRIAVLACAALAGALIVAPSFIWTRCRFPDTLEARTRRVEQYLDLFRLYQGRYPTQAEGLSVLARWGEGSKPEPLIEARLSEVAGCALTYTAGAGDKSYALRWEGECPPLDEEIAVP